MTTSTVRARATTISDVAYIGQSVVCWGRTAHLDAFAPEPPALAIDNVLPEDLTAYTQQKVLDLLAAGAQSIWLLYPLIPCVAVWSAGRVARSFGAGETLPEPPGFAGLTVVIDDLFDWSHGTARS